MRHRQPQPERSAFTSIRSRSQRENRTAFTLVELLVVIAIIGTLVGLLLPAVQAAREAARSNTCKSNLTQLQKALASRESSLGDYPGYINKLGIAGSGAANQTRASWLVMLFPYMEQNNISDRWSQGQYTLSGVELLVCPSDPAEIEGAPNNSYVANTGFIQRDGTSESGAYADSDGQLRENLANGVFFDLTRTEPLFKGGGAPGPTDIRDTSAPDPLLKMRPAYIQAKGDGMTNTLMLSENLNATFWGYADSSAPSDRKFYFGMCWDQLDDVVSTPTHRINGKIPAVLTADGPSPSDFSEMTEEDGFPSSNHPGGVNAAFCGGSVVFIADQIEPLVYAQLMTSNSNKSDLFVNGVQERGSIQPSGDDY